MTIQNHNPSAFGTSLIDRSLPFDGNNHFRSLLAQSNARKQNKDPVALILRATHDHNQTFSNHYTESLILHIAQTHRVVIRAIAEGALFGQKIEAAASLVGRNINLLVVMGHGTADKIEFGSDESAAGCYTYDQARKEDFEFLTKNAQIFLISCSTGKNLAQKISEIAQRTVFAPIDALSLQTIRFFEIDQNIKMSGKEPKLLTECVIEFTPKTLPRLIATQAIMHRDSYHTSRAYLGELSIQPNSCPSAQETLGLFYYFNNTIYQK